MKVKKCTPNYIVYGELGRVPMSVHINARMIGFWARIVNGKKEKISRTLYDLENITTLVLAVFTFNFQVSQYKYIALRADCNSAAVSANITVSSAYSNKYNLKYTSISSLSNKQPCWQPCTLGGFAATCCDVGNCVTHSVGNNHLRK
jgi:hypothetical protein